MAAVEETDPAARIRDYEAIQAQVQRDSPFVIALQERTELVMRRNVKGYRQGLIAGRGQRQHGPVRLCAQRSNANPIYVKLDRSLVCKNDF